MQTLVINDKKTWHFCETPSTTLFSVIFFGYLAKITDKFPPNNQKKNQDFKAEGDQIKRKSKLRIFLSESGIVSQRQLYQNNANIRVFCHIKYDILYSVILKKMQNAEKAAH